jgi:hypothetical protein
MEGFRYRVPIESDKAYPVMHGAKDITNDFPIIPTGMLKIWRDENAEGDF